ncbi:hypothetical protein JHK87_000676 [Glycine soja]|nr:hypothetical protein JHK87_000676 [Glycine soja]KAG5088056.1 hypothetical protein JHK86_000668 [Glycine max]
MLREVENSEQMQVNIITNPQASVAVTVMCKNLYVPHTKFPCENAPSHRSELYSNLKT